MANILVSPGVSVSVTDESFYGGAGPGTVPLIVFATASNKTHPSGTGIAEGTVPEQANRLFLATSQRELLQTFGNPDFKLIQGTPVHGHELNEYGLHAAYQYLGISNRAYVMRADIDLAQLEASVTAPKGKPDSGTVWLDLNTTNFGVFQHVAANADGLMDPFTRQPVIVINSADLAEEDGTPKSTIGEDGEYAVVTQYEPFRMFEKISGQWLLLGSKAWTLARSHVDGTSIQQSALQAQGGILTFYINGFSFSIDTTKPLTPTAIAARLNLQIEGTGTSIDPGAPGYIAASPIAGKVVVSTNGNGIKFSHTVPLTLQGTVLSMLDITVGTYQIAKLNMAPHNVVPSGSKPGDVWIKTTSTNNGSKFAFKVYDADEDSFTDLGAGIYASDNAARVNTQSLVEGSIYVRFNNDVIDGFTVAGFEPRRWSGQQWTEVVYECDYDMPYTDPVEGTLWYNPDFKVDIMVADGDEWLGYRVKYPDTDPNGAILSGSRPLTQYDGTPLVTNDLWINTSDTENYPMIYRYNGTTRKWALVDNTDQSTPYGIVFRDARANSGPAYAGQQTVNPYKTNSEEAVDLTRSNYVDPDCVDPRLYMAGTMLFNTRFSTLNVKKWIPGWFNSGMADESNFDNNTDFTDTTYTLGGGTFGSGNAIQEIEFPALASAGRWVTASGNATDGSPYMGRKAQRQMIVVALSATVAGNTDLRSELIHFNLVATPGYAELIDEMVTLNTDKKEVAFIIGDTPSRLKPNGTDIQKWASNANNAVSNGDKGLTTGNTYVGLYYPWGLSTNVDGQEIMVPPSTVALRTMAYSDNMSYPWFAPAGFNRGVVTNAASVGYLNDEGEYEPVILNQGQRDVLYLNKINPIAYIPNRGLVVYGQKTLHPVESARDRINVARLENYLRYNLDIIAKPFLFEPNDAYTRNAFRVTIERFMSGLVTLRGLEDFVVICDATNNTPDRRDRNELWCDVLIAPVKAVEFIYLPIRIRNSGSTMEL